MKISCVILNYNDADTTMEQVKRICGYQCFEHIVVVDNCSDDHSMERLTSLRSDKVIVLCSKKNGGYGAGNNVGIRYSYDKLHMTHAVIANPDTEFTESCIRKMAKLFLHHSDIGITAAKMEDSSGKNQPCCWRLLPFFKDLLDSGPVCRRIFHKALTYPASYFQGKRAVYVDAVHGSMLMVDLAKMIECGGYDERVFLYSEEKILGWRMRHAGYRTVLLLNQSYLHHNSVSISKTFQSISGKQKLRHESTMHYYKEYMNITRGQEWFTRAFYGVILLEIWFFNKVLKMTW